MSELLQPGQSVHAELARAVCDVERFLGSGGQGEVYEINFCGMPVALKWYYPHYLRQDRTLRKRLETAVKSGPPSDSFLWPVELASAPDVPGFGYIMPLREERYVGLVDIMRRRAEPSFRVLTTAGLALADGFFQLHAKGLCYRDISFGNIFLDPTTGDVVIADNDNVAVDGKNGGGVLGTPRFMAPEIVRGEAAPSRNTDMFSLSVLLFYLFMMHHPLEGRREAEIHSLDLPAMQRLYGSDPLFIFDPADDSNRPVLPCHENATLYWPIYPQFLRDLFTRAFTSGLHDAEDGRVAESVWRASMVRLRDCIVYCGNCGLENFCDDEGVRAAAPGGLCWSCRAAVRLPPRLRLDEEVVMLNHDTELFSFHVRVDKPYDFSEPVAAVVRHPARASMWGLQNRSPDTWLACVAGAAEEKVMPGRSVALTVGTRIRFGDVEGEIET